MKENLYQYDINPELFDKVLNTVNDITSPAYQKDKDDETLVREYLHDYVEWSGDDYLEQKQIEFAYADWTDDEEGYLFELAKCIIDDYDLPNNIKRYIDYTLVEADLNDDYFIGENGFVFNR